MLTMELNNMDELEKLKENMILLQQIKDDFESAGLFVAANDTKQLIEKAHSAITTLEMDVQYRSNEFIL